MSQATEQCPASMLARLVAFALSLGAFLLLPERPLTIWATVLTWLWLVSAVLDRVMPPERINSQDYCPRRDGPRFQYEARGAETRVPVRRIGRSADL
jgi:hypothetical protein